MRPHILVTTALDPSRRGPLEADFDLTFDPDRRSGVRALLVAGDFRADAALIDGFPDLEIICAIGTGYDSIDLEACARRGVSVTNTAGANADAVADFAIGLMLSVTRGMSEAERLLRSGQWRGERPQRFFHAPGLTGRRVGVLGMGAIGRQIARRLTGFDVEIAHSGPGRKADLPHVYFPDLLDLATWADVLVLAHRADETNRGLIDASVLAALGPEGYIVNVSRGSAIDEDALVAALRSGGIAGAALDVFDAEPRVRSELVALERTVLTPHIAGGSSQSFDRMFQAVGDNLRAFFEGRPLVSPILDVASPNGRRRRGSA